MKQKKESAFVISGCTNPSGEIVYRVSGWLHGERIRRNFSTRIEARAEVQVLELSRLQDEAGVRTAITRLLDDDLREAETAFRWLKDKPRSLFFYLEFAFANDRAPENKMLDALSCRRSPGVDRAVRRSRAPVDHQTCA